MQSSPETQSLIESLRSTLTAMVNDATLTEEALCEDRPSVVLMQRANSVTAFAVGEQADYLPLYEAFKKHYLKKTVQWSTKDIAFVYCIPNNVEVEPNFCSRVEVDVYFCRKYALRFGENVAKSLARLPFLPLAPITPGVQTRPPSAQTLLRQRSIKADLATALVVPQKSSAASILKSCIDGVYGSPSPLETVATSTASILDVKDRSEAKLKSISIENFRAYRTKKVFELGSSVTVLYGPNGFGKTSFFDAIDFAVTGGIGRLKKASGGLSRAAKHLDCDDDSTAVTLTLVRDGIEHVIKRSLSDHNNAVVNGKPQPRKDVLSLLTGGTAPGSDRVDSMVDLFRATHLFSQENQELTRDVASKSELSSELVTRMLAFEDYASGLKKAEEVLKLAQHDYAFATTDIKHAQAEIDRERKELERLQGLSAQDSSSGTLDRKFSEIEHEIAAAGFDLLSTNIRDTRNVRSILESAAAEIVVSRTSLTKAINDLAALSTLEEHDTRVQGQLSERQAALKKSVESEEESANQLASSSNQLAELRTREAAIQDRLKWTDWAISTQPEYAQLISDVDTVSNSRADVSLQVAEANLNFEVVKAERQRATSTLETSNAALNSVSEIRARVQDVIAKAEIWTSSANTLTRLTNEIPGVRANLQRFREQRDTLQDAIREQTLVIGSAERALNDAKDHRDKSNALISELRNQVDGPECQLCGHDHGSTEALLQAIDKRLALADKVILLIEAASVERTKIERLLSELSDAVERAAQEELHLGGLVMQERKLLEMRADYEKSLASIGLSLTDDVSLRLDAVVQESRERELIAADGLRAAQQTWDKSEAAFATSSEQLRALVNSRKNIEEKLDSLKQRLNALSREARRASINLALSIEELSKSADDVRSQLNDVRSAVEIVNFQHEREKTQHAATRAAVETARTFEQQASQAVSAQQTRIQSILSELSAAKVDRFATREELIGQVSSATQRLAEAKNLTEKVSEIEVAVDTAATSAAFESIRQRILVHERRIEELSSRAFKVKPWVDYFTAVTKLLGTQQAVATEHFITEYGPRTAVIQQRLRPVYGFGGIEITSKDSAISVSVKRKDEKLRPMDYFSQSQVQTLVLGLFLTACSSQTWSGFSSIMMDDPVTHFDDLNTYALLDLILGLLSSSEGERQFVISTCDEKLLQLARQKFRHLDTAAKFYRFQAIGADGPLVTELVT